MSDIILDTQGEPLKIGDRVVYVDDDDKAMSGVVEKITEADYDGPVEFGGAPLADMPIVIVRIGNVSENFVTYKSGYDFESDLAFYATDELQRMAYS
jgi:hypothetical protein